MYTIPEVAAIFKVARQTIYKWIDEGRLSVIRIGGVVRISQEEVDRLKKGE